MKTKLCTSCNKNKPLVEFTSYGPAYKYKKGKCKTGELYDTGSMFMKEVECDNTDCNFYESDGCGCVTGDIDD